ELLVTVVATATDPADKQEDQQDGTEPDPAGVLAVSGLLICGRQVVFIPSRQHQRLNGGVHHIVADGGPWSGRNTAHLLVTVHRHVRHEVISRLTEISGGRLLPLVHDYNVRGNVIGAPDRCGGSH